MFKRIGIIAVFITLILGINLCFAEEQQNDEKQVNIYAQAQEIADMYNDCVYLYRNEVLSYNQFNEMFTDTTLRKNRFIVKNKKNIPQDLLEALNNIDRTFTDARNLWRYRVYEDYVIPKNNYAKYLLNQYPELQKVKRQGIMGLYNVEKMLLVLAQYCIESNSKLQILIDENTQESE